MIDTSRVLVIGGSGMVGSQISFGIKPSHSELNITDSDSVDRALERHQPAAVIHLAGLVDVKKCEENPGEAQRVNVDGARNVAKAAVRAAIPLVYFSTCMVFDGAKNSPYDESDTPHPLTVYGKTKLGGERETLESAPHSLVVRTGWLFGGLEHDTKFTRRFYEALTLGTAVRATRDRVGSPTYVPDLVSETIRLLEAGESGTAHVVNAGIASYFDVAEELKKLTGSLAEVAGVTQKELNPNEPARGSMEALVSRRGIKLRPHQEALAEYVDTLKSASRA